MAEIRLQIPDEVARKLQDQLGGTVKLTDIARDALTMFNWAIQEKAKGRVVLSADDQGEQLKQLVMPTLERVVTAPPSPGDKGENKG
jgi:hypothetical protein